MGWREGGGTATGKGNLTQGKQADALPPAPLMALLASGRPSPWPSSCAGVPSPRDSWPACLSSLDLLLGQYLLLLSSPLAPAWIPHLLVPSLVPGLPGSPFPPSPGSPGPQGLPLFHTRSLPVACSPRFLFQSLFALAFPPTPSSQVSLIPPPALPSHS